MKKQAILIMAHNNIWTLKKILENLDSEKFDIYVHLDKKSKLDEKEIINVCKYSKLFVYKEIDVRWGDISMVNCEIFLIESAMKNEEYLYYHLISGVDMPIKNKNVIYNFFEKNYPCEFVCFGSDSLPKEKENYYSKYQINMKNYRKNIFNKVINRCFLIPQIILKINRLKNVNEKIMVGANWFSITDKLAKYIVSKKAWINETYKFTRSADESFVQTLVYNSDFKEKLYYKKYDDNFEACKRLIDWHRGNPYVFVSKDFNEIKNSPMMFLRKVDENIDKEIIELITKNNKENNKDEIFK